MELEEQVMGIIINAGQSRSLCYEALHAAKAGDFTTADAKMQEAAHYSREAHLVQTQLIEADEGEGKTKMTLVMVHAQDHLMTSIYSARKKMIPFWIIFDTAAKPNKKNY
ncbi:TPA: PTS N,N'-diacetylchitobiose transporter subunit IIA [Klebsiella pneumoniae]|nr:PTS N,N'-diacetylchitobiose transporter subunit IIA [Klebsiella pneumoniae]